MTLEAKFRYVLGPALNTDSEGTTWVPFIKKKYILTNPLSSQRFFAKGKTATRLGSPNAVVLLWPSLTPHTSPALHGEIHGD